MSLSARGRVSERAEERTEKKRTLENLREGDGRRALRRDRDDRLARVAADHRALNALRRDALRRGDERVGAHNVERCDTEETARIEHFASLEHLCRNGHRGIHLPLPREERTIN